jgi:hypothetical protein
LIWCFNLKIMIKDNLIIWVNFIKFVNFLFMADWFFHCFNFMKGLFNLITSFNINNSNQAMVYVNLYLKLNFL